MCRTTVLLVLATFTYFVLVWAVITLITIISTLWKLSLFPPFLIAYFSFEKSWWRKIQSKLARKNMCFFPANYWTILLCAKDVPLCVKVRTLYNNRIEQQKKMIDRAALSSYIFDVLLFLSSLAFRVTWVPASGGPGRGIWNLGFSTVRKNWS